MEVNIAARSLMIIVHTMESDKDSRMITTGYVFTVGVL
jgi:hypothetical protein